MIFDGMLHVVCGEKCGVKREQGKVINYTNIKPWAYVFIAGMSKQHELNSENFSYQNCGISTPTYFHPLFLIVVRAR